jgi:hypothetical protein
VKKRENNSSEINLLDLIPVQNILWKENEQGFIVLLKPKFKNPFLAKHLLPKLKRPHYKVKLDEVGSFLWKQCDGKKTVKQIAEILKNHFGDKVDPLYERLGLFLQNLEKNKFIQYKNL